MDGNGKRIVACVNLLAAHPDLSAIEIVPREVMGKVREALIWICSNSLHADATREADAALAALGGEVGT